MLHVCRADLVPSYSFGESKVFEQVTFEKGSWGRTLQCATRTPVSPPVFLYYGRDWAKAITLTPDRTPLTTVGKEQFDWVKIIILSAH